MIERLRKNIQRRSEFAGIEVRSRRRQKHNPQIVPEKKMIPEGTNGAVNSTDDATCRHEKPASERLAEIIPRSTW